MKSGLKYELSFCKRSLSELQKISYYRLCDFTAPSGSIKEGTGWQQIICDRIADWTFIQSERHTLQEWYSLLFSIHSKLVFPLLSLCLDGADNLIMWLACLVKLSGNAFLERLTFSTYCAISCTSLFVIPTLFVITGLHCCPLCNPKSGSACCHNASRLPPQSFAMSL